MARSGLAGATQPPKKRARSPRYTPEEIERGLHAVALAGGNASRAHDELKAQGLAVSRQTLHKWATELHADRYEHVRLEVLPRIYGKIAQETEDLTRRYAKAEHKTLDRYEEELPNLKAGEVASALRNLATSRGISTDKANVLRDRPTAIVEHKSASEILRRLTEIGVIDGTAEELPSAADVALEPPAD